MTALYSIIDYTSLHPGADFDPEHYHPYRRAAWGRLAKDAKYTVADFFDEIIDIRESDEDSEVYDLTDALGCFLTGIGNRSGLSSKKFARPNDILISRLRSYLQEICIVPQREPIFSPLLSTEFLVFRPKGQGGNWLLPFLLSDDVQTVLRWSQTGNNHPRFRASTVLGLPVPSKIYLLIKKLNELAADALKTIESAIHVYPEAEAELLERIGYQELNKQPSELYYPIDSEVLNRRERIDPEHYQPKYERLFERLKQICSFPIKDLVSSIDKGTQPDEYTEGAEVIVVKSKNVFGQGIELTKCERTGLKVWGDETARLRENDVVINSTGVGTLGRAGVVHCDGQKIVASVDLLILRTNPKFIDPDYLSLFLNSPAGIAQSEQYQTGSSGQLHLYPNHVRKFLVFIPNTKNGKVDLAWQHTLGDKVRSAAHAKVEARAKLEEAKQLVEENI